MMSINTTYRTNEPEIMDDFSMEGETLIDALDKIARINQFLGGNKLTISGIEALIKNIPEEEEICIIDLGCGNGDMLRCVAEYAARNNRNFRLIGIDANPFTIAYAKESSIHYPNIKYYSQDIFAAGFQNFKYDIALCTLTLHHFKEAEVLQIMQILKDQATIGIVINDLHRSAIAYRLFQLLCFVFRLNEMSKKDGLTSILRGFKKSELIDFSNKLNLNKYTVAWKWAFRYQWIISKT